MQSKAGRIVIDTNLWISFLITKDFSKLDDIIFNRQCRLLFCSELLNEFIEVAKRPKLRRFFSEIDVESVPETIEEFADFVTIQSTVDACRDPKDNFLLSLSLDGNADFLLTGDKALLALANFGGTRIMTITDFLKETLT